MTTATNAQTLDERLREFHRNSGCDWAMCYQRPNVAVTAKESGQGLMTFCTKHAAMMDCPMLYFS